MSAKKPGHYGHEVLQLVRELARHAPTPEENSRAFQQAGVGAALFRKLRTGERSVSARSHAIIVAELDRRLAAALHSGIGKPWRHELLARLRQRLWLTVARTGAVARVKPAALLALASDRFDGTAHVSSGRIALSLHPRRPVPDCPPLVLARQIQPRQLAVVVSHFLANLARDRPTGVAATQARQRALAARPGRRA